MSAKSAKSRARLVKDEDEMKEGDEDKHVTARRARKAAAKAVPKKARKIELSEEEQEYEKEFGENAKPSTATVTRIAARNAPNRGQRGGRAERSTYDRGHMGRTANKRTSEFSEDEIQKFMQEDENTIPFVPDTPEWHYKWARVRLGDKDDGSNIVANLNGRMGFEVVDGPDMLPPGTKLQSLSIKSGDYQGGYQFRDTVLMRCPMRNHKLSIIAASRRTKALNQMLDAGNQAGFIPGESRTGIVVEENEERTGIFEEAAQEEEAA